jgi:D-ribulokinase
MYVIGIDVGTGSARAGVFDLGGQMFGTAGPISRPEVTRTRLLNNPAIRFAWRCVGRWRLRALIRRRCRAFGLMPHVRWWGFGQGRGAFAGSSGDPARNIIVWMDHRAVDQATQINATSHPVLAYVGGVISPEMETPKLLWLFENRPEVFNAAWGFFDRADSLTWKATGSLARSTCP